MANERPLAPVRTSVAASRLQGEAQIGVRVEAVLSRYEVGKHFDREISEGSLDYCGAQQPIEREAALDGVYGIRTS